MNELIKGLFEDDIELPDPAAQRRYHGLVGLEHIQDRLDKEAELILRPDMLEEWSRATHGTVLPAVALTANRPPLLVFAGDVGTGKTTLAETFGDKIARRHGVDILVKRLSLRARGTGMVGEMTRLIGTAFDEVIREARATGARRPVVLVVDEADAIAQSREASQMHHEDRAGVNALIRGLSDLADERLCVLVIMCTNRLDALDPAVRRRAAAEFDFTRPNEAQRAAVFTAAFAGVGLDEADVAELVALTGENGRAFGHTYSDIVNRIVPAVCLAAYPDHPITAGLIAEQIKLIPPTRPFAERSSMC